jgi:hypothetical protein
LETPQRRSEALALRITSPFSDIEPVNEQRVAVERGVIFTIEAPIAHQHVKPIDTP